MKWLKEGWFVPLAYVVGFFVMLAFAGIWSLSKVLSIQHADSLPDLKIVRIAHWQLESGYRDAFQSIIDDYNELHKSENVRVVQMQAPGPGPVAK